jgi:SAM-dependent methyltransferase
VSVRDPSGRVSFDRAAEYYDRTRALPAETLAGVVALLAAELAGRGRCLEIGVGTGRIALPLSEAGQSMAGIDVSPAMLAQLVRKSGGSPPFPLALADATRLPFRDAAFGAALSVHVLHLISQWDAAVAELLRVVCPGGLVLVDLGGAKDPVADPVEDLFSAEAGIAARDRPGLTREREAELDERLADAGCAARSLAGVPLTWEGTLAEHIDRLEKGIYSWTWGADQEARHRAAEVVRTWAAKEFGPLDVSRRRSSEIRYRAYDLPTGP